MLMFIVPFLTIVLGFIFKDSIEFTLPLGLLPTETMGHIIVKHRPSSLPRRSAGGAPNG